MSMLFFSSKVKLSKLDFEGLEIEMSLPEHYTLNIINMSPTIDKKMLIFLNDDLFYFFILIKILFFLFLN